MCAISAPAADSTEGAPRAEGAGPTAASLELQGWGHTLRNEALEFLHKLLKWSCFVIVESLTPAHGVQEEEQK